MQLAQDDDLGLVGLTSNGRTCKKGSKGRDQNYTCKSWPSRNPLRRLRLFSYILVICSLSWNIYLLSKGLQRVCNGANKRGSSETGLDFAYTFHGHWLILVKKEPHSKSLAL